jgi:hypothetical protein
MRHDLGPWMAFKERIKVTNVTITNIFKTVIDRHTVTGRHQYEQVRKVQHPQ